MTSASTNSQKKKGQKYQNTFAFQHNKGSKLTKAILESPIRGLCPKCVSIVEWRKNFRKYKPLSVPKKCTRCQEKSVQEAYHIMCQKCAIELGVCEKCVQPFSGDQSTEVEENIY